IVDDEIRLAKIGQLLLRGPYEHGVHEQRMVRPRADNAYFDWMIPAREPVETVNPGTDIEIVARALPVDGKGFGCDRDIDGTPPDIRFGVGMFYDSLVLGRAAGFGSRVGYQRAG